MAPSDNDNTFQPLVHPTASIMNKIVAMRATAAAGSSAKPDLVSQAGPGARGSVASLLPRKGAIQASLGGNATGTGAAASRCPLYIPTTLHLDIGDWPVVSDVVAEYIVLPDHTGEPKLVGVRVKAKDGSTIDIGQFGKIELGHGMHLKSYLAQAIWAAADLQYFTARQGIIEG